MKLKPILSKSQYIKGLQCPKALWFSRYRKDLKPEINASTQARYNTGNEIGLLARQCFPGGIEVTEEYWDIIKAAQSTSEFIADGHEVIYEATAIHPHDGSYSRIDILRKAPDTDEWDLIEVKSASGVKAYHINDLSLQYHAFHQGAYKIRHCYMLLIDNTYRRDGDIDPQQLFKLEDISEKVIAKQNQVEEVVENLIPVLASDIEPEAAIGARCKNPFNCDYKDHCWQQVPKYSIFNIYGGQKADDIAELIKSVNVNDIPADLIPGGSKPIDIASYKSGSIHIDKENIETFLTRIKYPVYYLDYETLGPAIPPYDGTGPYGQIPFQFSLHIQQESNGELQHHEFLHKEQSDPRETFTKKLIDLCGDHGSIIVYNQAFEAGCNNKLAMAFPEHAEALQQINGRMIDLFIPFKKRWLYHPAQMGSASIKYVLPAFTDLKYDEMDIADGLTASRLYQAFAEGRLPEEQLEKLWSDLSQYCELDTYAMVALVKVIIERVRNTK